MSRAAISLLLAVAALALGGLAAWALPSGSPSSAASSSASSALVASAAPLVRGAQIPPQRSSPPPVAAWRDAQSVGFSRSSAMDCRAELLREWLRVQCRNYTGVGLVAGDPKEVRTTLTGLPPGLQPYGKTGESLVTVELPLVRGASYVLTFLGLGSDYEGNMIDEADTLHVSWRLGAADPTLLFTRAAGSP